MSDTNRDLADFLKRARAAVDPARAGLPADSRVRRVPGLRREEVALLAGVSTDYYTRLEQGRRITPSRSVLDAIARALDLDDTGRAHLEHLVGAPPRGRKPPTAAQRVRPGLYQLLESLTGTPAMILGRHSDVLAINRLGAALIADFDRMRPRERSYARWMFLSPDARKLFADWDVQARSVVENLRLELGAHPGDPVTTALVDELSAASTDFGDWWAQHRVYQRTHGSKHLRHPVVGELTVDYETFTMPGDPDQTMFTYTTEAGTASREAMNLLISWTMSSATQPTESSEPA
ncbi:helix-turn-helix transcriptional regulator [Mycolicibacterium smegmatis]|uniref:Putative DNA-binding protein n=1 Tax=Mycolicibacterium smegmatis (strain MKD8) TaxID=1214915 RepID=A0A2U9PLN2_MYCSE|nr:helix-turn-helix transcriptional regulator [Mycolicibacterium smegmatis]AWT52637.1 putative DNA-binding protein [Mycolicibacterium smegmatis MKD8]